MSVQSQIIDAANRYGVDPGLALSVALHESSFQVGVLGPVTRSGERAIGTFQLMPATAASLGVDPYDPDQNIDGGVRYLGMMLSRFGDPRTALAAYNFGPTAVARGDAWPEATRLYVGNVIDSWGEFPSLTSSQPGAPPSLVPLQSGGEGFPVFSWAGLDPLPTGGGITAVLAVLAVGALGFVMSRRS